MDFKMFNHFGKTFTPFASPSLVSIAMPTCSFGETPDIEDTTARFQLTYNAQSTHPTRRLTQAQQYDCWS